MNNISIFEFIKKSPKAELHLHIEGTLEPDHLFKLAEKNNIKIPFSILPFICLIVPFPCRNPFFQPPVYVLPLTYI